MDKSKNLPLEGVTVLELGHTVMGPTCGLILADLGARVIKVERAPEGDETRTLTGFGSGFFPFLNRNKVSVAVDLKSDKGRQVVYRLVEKADVLIENFGPGTVERLGLGYERCSRINPGLIFCSLKGFLPGPYEKRPALDEVVQMMGGLAYMTGPTGRPLRAGASVVDILGGCFGAIGILTALHQRKETGRGQLVQASLYESVAFLVGQHMAVAAVTGQAPPPMPERGRTWSVYDLFQTADGQQVFLGVTSDRHWKRMAEVFGFNDLIQDERLTTNGGRVAERDWFLPELQNRISLLTKQEVIALAEKANIPFAPVARPEDLFEDPHLNEAGGLVETLLPHGRKAKLPKLPLRLSEADLELRLDPPRVGQGSRELLLSVGFSGPEIDELLAQGTLAMNDK
ncbi:MAG: CaiB/BaiF CoA-transferase family protein [Thermodesulfobacteriota bacterium]